RSDTLLVSDPSSSSAKVMRSLWPERCVITPALPPSSVTKVCSTPTPGSLTRRTSTMFRLQKLSGAVHQWYRSRLKAAPGFMVYGAGSVGGGRAVRRGRLARRTAARRRAGGLRRRVHVDDVRRFEPDA